jgi:methionyl-tRNA formyltransferase
VNWAVIHGETETGASLHYMVDKPDAGELVDQQAVPILPDDTAVEVFQKVTVAAELVLHRSLPSLLAGTAPHWPLDLTQGSYFGGRKPEDGRIDWQASARAIHDLVRGVAPPYPGAFFELRGRQVRVFWTVREAAMEKRFASPMLFTENTRCYAQCGDGAVLRIEVVDLAPTQTHDAWIASLHPLPAPLT